MTFPVLIPIGPWRVHSHPVFEIAGYVVGFAAYLILRQRRGDRFSHDQRWSLVTAALVGAVIGSRALAWFEEPEAAAAGLLVGNASCCAACRT